jgi:hypothetical protein
MCGHELWDVWLPSNRAPIATDLSKEAAQEYLDKHFALTKMYAQCSGCGKDLES